LRDRQTEIIQQVMRVFLVARYLDRDVTCFAGNGCLNALLEFAVPKLDEVVSRKWWKFESGVISG